MLFLARSRGELTWDGRLGSLLRMVFLARTFVFLTIPCLGEPVAREPVTRAGRTLPCCRGGGTYFLLDVSSGTPCGGSRREGRTSLRAGRTSLRRPGRTFLGLCVDSVESDGFPSSSSSSSFASFFFELTNLGRPPGLTLFGLTFLLAFCVRKPSLSSSGSAGVVGGVFSGFSRFVCVRCAGARRGKPASPVSSAWWHITVWFWRLRRCLRTHRWCSSLWLLSARSCRCRSRHWC